MPLQTIDSIATPRLTMRGVTEGDLDDLFEINGDAQVTRFLPYANWQTSDDAQAWLRRTRAVEAGGSGQQLVMVARDSGKVIGTVLLFRYEEPSARIELGYVLGRLHWGSGVMAEALHAVCSHVFSALAIRRIEAQVNPHNLASNRLLLRLGFSCEGTLRQRWVNQDQAVDTNFYGLLADDWKGREQGVDCASALPPVTFPVAVNAAEVAPRSKLSNYPEPFASTMAGREKRALGAVFGLQNFGVNLTRLAPHSVSALRHAHTRQDEFIYVLSGRPSLQTDEGSTLLAPGMCAGFRAATGNGHRLVNEHSEVAVYLEIGDRSPGDSAVYPDDDIQARMVDGAWQFTRKDGTPYA